MVRHIPGTQAQLSGTAPDAGEEIPPVAAKTEPAEPFHADVALGAK
jgi:hypothetical protein